MKRQSIVVRGDLMSCPSQALFSRFGHAAGSASNLENIARGLAEVAQNTGAQRWEHIRQLHELTRQNAQLVEQIRIRTAVSQLKLGGGGGMLTTAVQEAPVGIVVCNERARITRVNLAAKRLADIEPKGYSLDRAPSIFGEMYDAGGTRVPPGKWPWMRALHGEQVDGMECHLVRPGRDSSNVLFSSSPVTGAAGKLSGAVASIVDITQHEKHALVLRGRAVEEERNRIATDIHDTVAQDLTAVLLQLAAVEQNLPEHCEHARQHLRLAYEMAQKGLAEARRSIWSLGHASPENEDLAIALSFLAKQMLAGVPINLILSLPRHAKGLSSDIRRELLRIGKEAIANVVKHARASKLEITLRLHKHKAELQVEDNGRGFRRSPAPKSGGGFGVPSMRVRAQRLGGSFALYSEPGRGTRLIACLPLSPCSTPEAVISIQRSAVACEHRRAS
jgi:signal transduction histidine kinase